MRRCIYKKIHYLTFDLDLGVKVIRNVTQYPLHHVIYAPTKFEVATSNGLGEDTITRNVTDGRTDRQTDRRTDGRTTDRLWYEINIPYFSYEKAGITNKARYFMRIVCQQTILMEYPTLIFPKIRKEVKFVICCSCDWRFKG